MKTITECAKKIKGWFYPTKRYKATCETCKHYSCYDGDDYYQGIYQAVFRNSCELHEEPMYRYWEDSCKDWESNEEVMP